MLQSPSMFLVSELLVTHDSDIGEGVLFVSCV